MEKLKAAIFDRIGKLDTNKPLSTQQIATIQRRISEAFQPFRTPTHPTYCSMIENAIKELNDKDGSSEDAICEYIFRNYEGLPWAHNKFLTYYLDKLCKSGEVVNTSTQCYTLPCLTVSNKRLKSRRKRKLCPTTTRDGNQKTKFKPSEIRVIDDGEQEDEVRTQGLSLDHVECGANSILVSSQCVKKKSDLEPVEGDPAVVSVSTIAGYVPEDKEMLDHVECGANSILVSSECVKKSDLEPVEGDPAVVSVSTIAGYVPEDKEMLDLKVKDHSSYATDLMMILPFHASPKPVEKIEIVCCLPCPVSGQQQRTHRVYRSSKKRLNHQQEFPTLLESSTLELPLHCQHTHTSSSPCGSNLMMSVREGSIEHEHRKQKLHSKSSSSSGKCELVSKEDGDMDIPLQQILEKHGKQRKTVLQTKEPRAPIASSMSDAALQTELTDSIDIPKVMPEKGETMFCNRRNQSLGGRQLSKRQLGSKRQKSCSLEAVEAPQSETMQTFQLEGGSNDSCEKHEGQGLQIARSLLDATSEKFDTKLQHQQQGKGQDPGSSPYVEVIAHTMCFDDQHHEMGENQQIKGDHDIFYKPEQKIEVNLGKSSGAKHSDQEEFASSVAEATSEQFATKLQHQQKEEGEDPDSSPYVAVTADTLCSHEQHHDLGETQQMKGDHGLFYKTERTNEVSIRDSSWVEHKNGRETDLKDQNQHHEPQERPSEPASNIISEEAASMYQGKFQEEENDGGVACLHLAPLSVKPALQCHHVQGKMPISDQHCQLINKKIKRRGRPRKQKEESKDAAASLNLHHEKRDGLNDRASHQQSEQQNKKRKKDGRGRPKKHKEAIGMDASLNLNDQQQEMRTTCQQFKKDGRGRPCREKEVTTEDIEGSVYMHDPQQEGLSELSTHQKCDRGATEVQIVLIKEASLNLHDKQIEGPSEPSTCKLKKRDGRGRPRKQKVTTIEDVATLLNLHDQQQEGSPRPATCQSEKQESRGRRRKQIETITQDVGAVNFHNCQQDGLSELARHWPVKKDEQGTPIKEKDSTTNDTTVLVNLHLKQKEMPSESAIFMPEKKDGRGRPKKQKVMECEPTKDVAPVLYMHGQQEGVSETSLLKKKDHEGWSSDIKEWSTEDLVATQNFQDRQRKKLLHPTTYQRKMKNRRGRPKKQTTLIINDAATDLHLQDQQQDGSTFPTMHAQQHECQSELSIPQREATSEYVVSVLNLHDQKKEGSPEPTTHQMKKDGRGRPRKSKGHVENSPMDLDLQQQGWPSEPEIHSFLDASSVFCQPGKKKRLQQNDSCPDFKPSTTSDGPVSLRTRSSMLLWKHKQDEQGGAYKSEDGTNLSGSQADHCLELEFSGLEYPLESTPATGLLDEASHQHEMEQKPDQEEKLPQFLDEQSVQSQTEVYEVPSEKDKVTKLSDDETPQQQKSKQVLALVNEPHQQQEEKCQHVEKQGRLLRSETTLPQQKFAKGKPVQIPLSSKNWLRSRSSGTLKVD